MGPVAAAVYAEAGSPEQNKHDVGCIARARLAQAPDVRDVLDQRFRQTVQYSCWFQFRLVSRFNTELASQIILMRSISLPPLLPLSSWPTWLRRTDNAIFSVRLSKMNSCNVFLRWF